MSNVKECECKIYFESLHPNAKLPINSEGNVGWDICCVSDDNFGNKSYSGSNKDKRITLYPGEKHVFSTGLRAEITPGYAVLLWDRSGLSAKHSIHRLAGVIDSSYRGEWKICLVNLGNKSYDIEEGDKIIQGIVTRKIETFVDWSTEPLSETNRGGQGFGSTGK